MTTSAWPILSYAENPRLSKTPLWGAYCARFGISRKTGYKWVERYEHGGVELLTEKSRASFSHPNAVAESVVEEILDARRKHPRWGPRKLLVVLKRRKPDLLLPVSSTVGEILKRNGLIKPRRRKTYSSNHAKKTGDYELPNSTWCADFKGHFPVGGKRCHPLTISDGHSRYLLACKGLSRPQFDGVQRGFEEVFKEYGLPDRIRTDNGAPFSTLAPAGLSKLAVWWIRLGIMPERIMPGRPDQNGRHERMHRTLKAETALPPRSSMRAQQQAFNKFREEYNHERPHEALDLEVPASIYQRSNREFPRKLPEPEYPVHFKVERVYPNGVVTCDYTQWYLSACLGGELVGMEEVDSGRWKVYFGPVPLGIIDARGVRQKGCRQFGILIRSDGEISGHKKYRRRH